MSRPLILRASVFTRAELDLMECKCGEPACPGRNGKLYQTCHPEAGMLAHYHGASGLLALVCAKCEAPVARVQVAWAVPS